jgi:hypothetical protein
MALGAMFEAVNVGLVVPFIAILETRAGIPVSCAASPRKQGYN